MSAPSGPLFVEVCPVHGGVVSKLNPCREVVLRCQGRTTYCHRAEEVEVIPVADAQKVEAERDKLRAEQREAIALDIEAGRLSFGAASENPESTEEGL